GRRVLSGAAVLAAGTLLLFIPWRAVDKYYHYRGMRPEVRRLAAEPSFRNAIVLVRGRRFPDYASAVVYNPLDPQGADPLFTWDRGPEVRRKLVQAYPGRPFWVVNGPTVTGHAYEIVAGPLRGSELLARADSLAPGP
ncbi:MAG TPA: hypothetical protein VGQ73_06865, partial [Gemmatimonadales bacterium]|nr:hypothetical protein [Gemmatimonadales bacterium]